MIGLKLGALAAVAAFSSGFLTGTIFVYNRWNVSNMSVQAAQYRRNLEALNKITGANQKIDDDAMAATRSNNEIIRKIEERFRSTSPGSVDSDVECIDADSMQDIRSIQ